METGQPVGWMVCLPIQRLETTKKTPLLLGERCFPQLNKLQTRLELRTSDVRDGEIPGNVHYFAGKS